jgi:hypothetical protein
MSWFFYYAAAPLGLNCKCLGFSIMLPPRWGCMVGVVIFLLCCRPAGAGWWLWLYFYYASAPLGLDGWCGCFSIMLPPRWGYMVFVSNYFNFPRF